MLESLALEDVQRILRLLNSVMPHDGLSDDVRRRKLVSGLADLIGADVWCWVRSRYSDDLKKSAPFSMIDGGWTDDRHRSDTLVLSQEPGAALIHEPYLNEMLRVSGAITRARDEIIAPDTWHQADYFQRWRATTGLNDFLISLFPVPPNAISGIAVHRLTGRPDFGPRERCIMHLVFSELSWIHGDDVEVPASKDVLDMTERQRQIMLLVLGGQSRRAIAKSLCVSEYTVADHLKKLHKRFDVTTRGELVAKFMSGNGRAV